MSPTHCIKQQQRAIIARYNKSDDSKGSLQVLTTLASLVFIWLVALLGVNASRWITAACIPRNNVVLLALWVLMSWVWGTALFFTVYLVSLSIAGGAGVILFTVQHNFEHAYATDCERWDYTTGAIKGTSFLVLPRWLNWFTVDMGYHHIHHLSTGIPNYSLVKCHDEYRHLFVDVTRVKLSQLQRSLKCILWDVRAQRIISLSEYQRQI